jgi:glutaredoxin
MTKNGGLLFPTSINLSQPVPKQEEPAQTVIPKTDKPNVKFFVMSFCPHGQQAENGLGPVYGSLKDSVVMEPHYVIYSNYAGGGPNYCMDNESKYCSMHGVQELHEDVRQLCVYKNYNMSTWWNYISKINAQCSYGNVDSCWESAANASGVDVQKIQTCFNTEGLTLLANELSLNAKFGVQESPQVFINDVEYQGGRAPANFQSAICSAFNTEPSGCSDQLNGTAGAAAGSCS